MSDAPERIWAAPNEDGWRWPDASKFPMQGYEVGVQVAYMRADLHEAEVARLMAALDGLRRIVEGIDGAMEHGTWRDEYGIRFKDTPEWVEAYNASSPQRPPEAPASASSPIPEQP